MNRNTVVVINAGSPIRFGDWLGSARAVLQVWYAGQEYGNALADVLSGTVNPSGRLPMTLPKRIEALGERKLTALLQVFAVDVIRQLGIDLRREVVLHLMELLGVAIR